MVGGPARHLAHIIRAILQSQERSFDFGELDFFERQLDQPFAVFLSIADAQDAGGHVFAVCHALRLPRFIAEANQYLTKA